MEKKSFAFLAHRVESWNALLDSRLFDHLHKNPQFHWFWIWLAPLYWLVSAVSLFTKRSHETVDRFQFANMNSQTVLLRNYAWHFLFGSVRKTIKQRILRAVLSAQKDNQVIGLGALTKAEWLTQGGQWVVNKLGDKLHAFLVHGDTLTAAAVLKMVDAVFKKYHLGGPVFITGATSKIGRAVVLKLAENQVFVKMYTKSEERFVEIKEAAGRNKRFISKVISLKDGADCQLWLTGKSKPSGKKLLWAIPKGAVVMNFSVPNPLGENNHKPKLGVLAIEAGLLAYNPAITNLRFTMRLRPGLTYACHAGTVVHAHENWQFHEVGQVELPMLKEVWRVAKEIGFFLPVLPEVEAQVIKESKPLWKNLADMPAGIVL